MRDRAVLFGDGAGAMVLEANESGDGRGFLGFVMKTDGTHWDKLYVPGGGCKSRPYFTPEMFENLGTIPIVEGRQVFRLASQLMPEAVREVLAKTGHRLEELDLLLMHQANLRINEAVQKILGLPDAKVFNNIQKYGNTTAATLPLVYDEAVAAGTDRPGRARRLHGPRRRAPLGRRRSRGSERRGRRQRVDAPRPRPGAVEELGEDVPEALGRGRAVGRDDARGDDDRLLLVAGAAVLEDAQRVGRHPDRRRLPLEEARLREECRRPARARRRACRRARPSGRTSGRCRSPRTRDGARAPDGDGAGVLGGPRLDDGSASIERRPGWRPVRPRSTRRRSRRPPPRGPCAASRAPRPGIHSARRGTGPSDPSASAAREPPVVFSRRSPRMVPVSSGFRVAARGRVPGGPDGRPVSEPARRSAGPSCAGAFTQGETGQASIAPASNGARHLASSTDESGPGRRQSASASASRITGIRAWTGRTRSFASVVTRAKRLERARRPAPRVAPRAPRTRRARPRRGGRTRASSPAPRLFHS